MNFLEMANYIYSGEINGNSPGYIFEKMILYQINVIIPVEKMVEYINENNVDGLSEELSKYGSTDNFFTSFKDYSNRKDNIYIIQSKVAEYFKNYILLNADFLSAKDITDKSDKFLNDYYFNSKRRNYLIDDERVKIDTENITKIEELDKLELDLNIFIKNIILEKTNTKRK